MNNAYYFRNFIDDKFLDRLEKISIHNDYLSTVLTVHLASEKIINGWICYKTQSDKTLNGMDRFSFSQKLQLAKNLDLPKNTHDFFMALNKMRNKFAHNLQQDEISGKELQDLENHVKPLLAEYQFDSLSHAYVYGQSLNDKKKYSECSKNVKLSYLFKSIYFCMNRYLISLK